MVRTPCIRVDADGNVVDATCIMVSNESGGIDVSDFRDLAGQPLDLPPGSSFRFVLDLSVDDDE